MSTLKVVAVQMTSTELVDENLQEVLNTLEQLKNSQVDIASFPENSLFMRVSSKQQIAALTLEHKAITTIQAAATRLGIAVHLGSIPLLDEKTNKCFNSTVILEPGQKPKAFYNKIHLFDAQINNHRAYRESDVFNFGETPQIWSYKNFHFGLSICYDLRFSELYLFYAKQKVDALFIPAAFTVPTGLAHWHVLLRARAIECQAYVIAAAQSGQHRSQISDECRETFGHSLIVDPWGEIIAECDADKKFVIAQISEQKIAEVRAQIPISQHRRL